jgi:hypothetical protein
VKALEDDSACLEAAKQLLVLPDPDEAADVGDRVLLRAHEHRVGVREHPVHDLAEGRIRVTVLAPANEPRVLGEPGDVEDELLLVRAREASDLANVRHRDRLPAPRVVRNRQHHDRDALALVSAEELLELADVHVALEGRFGERVQRLGYREVEGDAVAHLDVSPRRVEVRVGRDDLPRVDDRPEEDALRAPALMRGKDEREAEDLAHGVPEAVEAA